MNTTNVTIAQCFNKMRKAVAKLLTNRLFEFCPSTTLASAHYGLSFKKEYSKYYQDLKHLHINVFVSMVIELLSIQTHCSTSRDTSDLTILSYNYSSQWKKYVSFYLKLYPRTVDEYRDTIWTLLWNDDDDEEVLDALTNNKKKPTEANYMDYRLHLKHIQEHGYDPDFFQQHPAKAGCAFGINQLLISRKGICLVGLDSIDFDPTSDHSYRQAYQYARALEEELGKEVLGRVYFGIDHNNRKIWVWGLCIVAEYEVFVSRSGVVKNGEFKDSICKPKRTQLQQHCVYVKNLPVDVNEEMVKKHLNSCGVITKINLHRYRDGDDTPSGTAKVFFEHESSVDNAVGLDRKIITCGNIWRIKYSYLA